MADVNYFPLIQLVQESFRPEAALGVDFSANLIITGEKEETWFLQVKAGKCIIQNANGEPTDAQVTLSQDNLLRLLRGDLNPTLAVFTGKINLSGNQSGLLKLASLFDIDKEKLKAVLQEYR